MATHSQLNEKDLERFAAQGVSGGLFAGCVIGASDNGDIIIAGSNTLIPLTQKTFGPKTLFDIASAGKPMVAAAILKLIEQGKLTLNTPVSGYIGGTGKRWKEITIWHLLTNSLKLDINPATHFLPNFNPEEVEMIITTADVKLLGDGYYYHNSNIILLGWILERIFGMKLRDILRKEIFEPAGMRDTFFSTELPEEVLENIPPSFNRNIGNDVIWYKPQDDLANMYARHGQDTACAGIFSTAGDVLAFANYIMYAAFKKERNGILSHLVRNHLAAFSWPSGKPYNSGLGFDKPADDYICPCFARNTVAMTGFTGCAFWFDQSKKKALTILTNVTYPENNTPREMTETGPRSTLFDYRRTIATRFFFCKSCHS